MNCQGLVVEFGRAKAAWLGAVIRYHRWRAEKRSHYGVQYCMAEREHLLNACI
jgi:hypothetical protein